MKNVLVGIVFLLGSVSGIYAGTHIKEELVYKIPVKYLTFGRLYETQAAKKVYEGERPEGGSVVYILGGSAGYASVNEASMSEKLTERMGEPVRVYVVATPSQHLAESYSMISKMPKNTEDGKAFVMVTWSGHRIAHGPDASIRRSFKRDRMLMRHDAVREMITDKDVLNEPFIKNKVSDTDQYLREVDKEDLSSVGSFWFKYFIHDKVKKVARYQRANSRAKRRRPFPNIFTDKNIFMENDYSERRLSRTLKSYKRPAIRARYEKQHKRYLRIIKTKMSNVSEENGARFQEYALYMMGLSNEMAKSRGYTMGALELPLNEIVHNEPILDAYRRKFNEQIAEASDREGYSEFHLDDTIDEIQRFEYWYDAGHMNAWGRKKFEPYYLDALVRLMTGAPDGVYGIEPGPDPSTDPRPDQFSEPDTEIDSELEEDLEAELQSEVSEVSEP